jgi:hypothetical protein
MDTDLRIPVTAEQKALILEATRNEPEGMAAWARSVLLEAARTRVAALRSLREGLEAKFRTLAQRWKDERGPTSSSAKMAAHPAYREIVSMGWDVVPLLLAELKRQPDHWFQALHEITGADPVPRESRGRVREMVAAWLRWGEENDFLR